MTQALQTSIETWKPWKHGYWASDHGNIKSPRGRIRKHTIATGGRHHVVITDPMGLSTVGVASIVLEAFVQPWEIGLYVHHIDGDLDNLHLSNLKWVRR